MPCDDTKPVLVSKCFLESLVRSKLRQDGRGEVVFSYSPDALDPKYDVMLASLTHPPDDVQREAQDQRHP